MKKVFLGGTCNGSNWRENLIKLLTIDFFNPVVDEWTPECMDEEIKQRQQCDYCLYVITPRMTGVFSIAEVVDDSNKQPNKTVFCVLYEDGDQTFTPFQIESLQQVGCMVQDNGGFFANNLISVSEFLNQ